MNPRRVKNSTSKVRQKSRLQPEHAGVLLERLDDLAPHPVVQPLVLDDERADLAQVLPHHVKGAAADQLAVGRLGDHELLHGLEEHDEVLAEQDAALDERGKQRADAGDVGRSRRPDAIRGGFAVRGSLPL